LALRFHPEVVAHLAERDFQLPALNKPAQDLHGILGSIGAQQSLRLEPAEGIAHQPLHSHSTRYARGTFGCSAQRIGTTGIPL